MQAIQSAYQTVNQGIDQGYEAVGKFLDKNPTLYKVVLVACHFFRTIAMVGLMLWLPVSLPVKAAIIAGGTLLYRASVERFCCFRFAIPSRVGSLAVLAALGKYFAAPLAYLPLLAYTGWVIYLSHRDIEKRMAKLDHCSSYCESM